MFCRYASLLLLWPLLYTGTVLGASPSGGSPLPHTWQVRTIKHFRISVPEDARLDARKDRIRITWRGTTGDIITTREVNTTLEQIINRWRPQKIFRKGESYVLFGEGWMGEIVVRAGKTPVVTAVKATDLRGFKTVSLALASIKPLSPSTVKTPHVSLPFHQWTAEDGSFTIEVPRSWEVDGGTVDLGVNGYVRMVVAQSADENEALLGIYSPFYSYLQTGVSGNGTPPMSPRDYIEQRFFDDLSTYLDITFDDVDLSAFHVDEQLSAQLTRANAQLATQYGVSVQSESKVFDGTAECSYEGQPCEMRIMGIMSYSRMPLQGIGETHQWGPAPVILGITRKGELDRWKEIFLKIAESWQPKADWLIGHAHRARQETRDIVRHYRRMSKMIHEGYEQRSQASMAQWDAEQKEKEEEFYDLWHAMGGEDRYEDTDLHQEVDVPTGADKYLWDRYSQTWVGIRYDQPDAEELEQHLKEEGFTELKLHTH